MELLQDQYFNKESYSTIPKHYNLFFCGDSWTFGEELGLHLNSGQNEKDKDVVNYRIVNRFSSVVSNQLNKSHFNLSEGGKCNDWITKSSIDWFERGNTCDVAIVQLTYAARKSYYYKDFKLHQIRCLKDRNLFSKNDELLDLEYEIFLPYYKSIYTPYESYQNYAKNLFLLDNYFKNKSIKVIYLTIETFEDKFFVTSIPDDYYISACNSIFVKSVYSLVGKPKNKEFYCSSFNKRYKGGHPNKLGHEKIANWIISQLSL